MKYDSILQTLCTQWQLKTESDFQSVYEIPDAKEAKLAFDVLRSFGIETKVYADGISKLYITNPSISPEQFDEKMKLAAAYASVLSPIKREMDAFTGTTAAIKSPDYTMTFANTGTSGKQIVITVSPANAQPEQISGGAPSSAPRTQQAANPTPSAASGQKYMRRKDDDSMFAGPQLLRDNKKIISKKEREKQEADTYWRQLSLYIKGNSAVAAGIIVLVIVALFSIFSMFIVSKGFLCPDLAHKQKVVPWYCKNPELKKEKDPNALPDFDALKKP